MEKKIKNEKTTFTKCYRFVYLACCVSVQLAPMTDKHFLYLCINTLSWTQMSDYKLQPVLLNVPWQQPNISLFFAEDVSQISVTEL